MWAPPQRCGGRFGPAVTFTTNGAGPNRPDRSPSTALWRPARASSAGRSRVSRGIVRAWRRRRRSSRSAAARSRSPTRRRSTSRGPGTRSSTSSATTSPSPTGRCTGVAGRPMALKRFVDGAEGEPFFQKRAPDNRPDWIRTAELTFPSGPDGRRDRPRRRGRPGLGRQPRLHRPQPAPRPRGRPRPPRRAARRPRPRPGRALVADPRRRARDARGARGDVGLVGWPKTSGSRGIHINVRIERRWTYPEVRRAALALARDVERRVPDAATSKWWKEERHGVFLDYNQNAKDRTVASAYSVRPLPDARVSTPLTWDEVPTVEAEAFTLDTVPARYAAIGDPGAGIDEAVGSLEALLELSHRHEAEGLGDAPWPPNYAQAGRRAAAGPAVTQAQGRRRVRGRPRRGGRAAARGRGGTGQGRRRRRPERGAARPSGPARSPTPTGRRKTSIPVIEIARAETKAEALEGLERWKARHPAAAAALEPADVLVDGMRGRSYVWYRVRVNLTHVPEADRPAQGPLEVDYDPWAGYEWPDRAGQLERSPRRPAEKKPDEPDATVARRLRARAVVVGCTSSAGVNGTQRGRAVAPPVRRSSVAPSPSADPALVTAFLERLRDPAARYRVDQTLDVVVGQASSTASVALGRVGRRPADRLRQHRRRQDDPLGVPPGGRGGVRARGRRGLARGRAGPGDGRAVLVPEGERPALRRSPGPRPASSSRRCRSQQAIPIGGAVAESLGVTGGTANVVAVRLLPASATAARSASRSGSSSPAPTAAPPATAPIEQDYTEFGGDIVVEPPVG